MLKLMPITLEQIKALDGSSYGAMSYEERVGMITESQNQLHDGKYFEFFVVYLNEKIIGFMNLHAHCACVISCGPEIKPEFRRMGYAFEAETLALKYAKEKGYKVAVGNVNEDNIASQKLHEKLGFNLERKYVNKNNRRMREYKKVLEL